MWMGWVTLTDKEGKITKVDKSWGYKMNTKGKEKFRALAESVKRAFQTDMCKTLNLPSANYEKWKIIQFNFDASQMIEG